MSILFSTLDSKTMKTSTFYKECKKKGVGVKLGGMRIFKV